ncbi:hypothetical protein [uncultured Microbacterium sp.]|uniref:hypothetical protein n=1 Tax=uncultured Microbacterium sp. TaxID=191216 RepID=UPI0028D5E6A9|nr:hypothetical protein [uncultured Microbacterium sp.]
MSTMTQTRTAGPRRARRAALTADQISLAPRAAREAVGRATGIEPVAVGVARSPLWRDIAVAGLVALVAAGSLAVIAELLSLPL